MFRVPQQQRACCQRRVLLSNACNRLKLAAKVITMNVSGGNSKDRLYFNYLLICFLCQCHKDEDDDPDSPSPH